MKVSATSRKQLRLNNIIFVLLFLLAVGLLQWLSKDYSLQFDWTQNSRHSLSEATITALSKLDKPLKIVAFASVRQGQRKVMSEFIARYQRHKPDLTLEFVDPDKEPERVRSAGVQFDGELLIEFGGSRETITKLTEEALTNALTRLGHRGERWVVFLGGHGERSPDGKANFDLSDWTKQLRKRGFSTKALQLGENPQIPQNTTVLVLAGPRTNLLAGEVKAIQGYIENGGNMLWLGDPDKLYGLEPLAEQLGIEFQSGVLVDPSSQIITGSATAIVIANYNNHPVVKNFTDITLFPDTAGIQYQTLEGWKADIVLDTRETTWSESGTLQGRVQYDKGKDIPGPLNIAIALTRDQKDKPQQRVLVTGDGDFLSNTYLGNGGNLDLGLSLVNWLSRDDNYVSIPVRTTRDRNLDFSRNTQYTIVGVFLFVLPLALITGGILVWLRRRKR